VEVVAAPEGGIGPALTRDLILDGRRRFDLPVTVVWIDGVGLNLWAHYGPSEMEAPRRVLLEMLHANGEYPFVKFGLSEDDRPLLMTELSPTAVSEAALGHALVRLAIVADRLLEVTAPAVASRGRLPDWEGRTGRNDPLLERYGPEVEATMPPWVSPPTPVERPPRRSWRQRLFGGKP
jgi:hypothetical protein